MSWLASSVSRWFDRGASKAGAAGAARWIVLDVESSGLDPAHDELLAVAAVAVVRDAQGLVVLPQDSFEAFLRPRAGPAGSAPAAGVRAATEANVLVHGIGLGARQRAEDPAAVLRDFAAWVAGAPLFGFHVGFDRQMLVRCASQLAPDAVLRGPWIDLEALAAVTHPREPRGALDDWLTRFAIPCAARHQAAADVLATAELLQRLWPRLVGELGARRIERDAVDALVGLQAARRWVAP